MLAQLLISNFAIVRELEIDFQDGMTAITGETGAGKSIALDALELCLGGRAEANMVRQGSSRTDICARFILEDTPTAQQWLEQNQLEDGNECLLRRVINNDGRSRGFINGTAVPLFQLRELGQMLVQIHGQHAHQLLLKPEHQKKLLDAYANECELKQEMSARYHRWNQSCQELKQHQQLSQEREARRELLQYQLKELNEFAPQPGEYQCIDEEYKRMANSGQLLMASQQTLHLLSEKDDNIQTQLARALRMLEELISTDTKLKNVSDMLEEAAIQINEASNELSYYGEHLDADSGRLEEVELRLSRQINLARKHQVAPEILPELHQQLVAEHEQLTCQQTDAEDLTKAVSQNHELALETAQQLHQHRMHLASELSQQITDSMQQLAMPHGKLMIGVQHIPEQLNYDGADRIEFIVSTNPGQPLQGLSKVASGGELSRIALAIQVITSQRMDTPALIFDEIDVGISGPTAAIIGKMLRQVGETTQVMCVTHLPQVAGAGHHHLLVTKETDGAVTETHMQALDKPARLQELARLLGGSQVTRHTLANAKELLTV